MNEPTFKPGREVLDPAGAVVTMVRRSGWDHEGKPLLIWVNEGDDTPVWYPRSMLRATP